MIKRFDNLPYDFNVYLKVFSPGERKESSSTGIKFPEWLYNHHGVTEEEVPFVNGKINVLFTWWEADPPTAWTIIHRFFHIVQGYLKIQEIFHQEYEDRTRDTVHWRNAIRLMFDLGTMRSARNKSIENSNEAVHEYATQYVMTGKITLGSTPDWIKKYGFKDEFIPPLELKLNEHMKKVMEDIKDTARSQFFVW